MNRRNALERVALIFGGTVIGVMLAGVMANRTKLYQIFDKSKS